MRSRSCYPDRGYPPDIAKPAVERSASSQVYDARRCAYPIHDAPTRRALDRAERLWAQFIGLVSSCSRHGRCLRTARSGHLGLPVPGAHLVLDRGRGWATHTATYTQKSVKREKYKAVVRTRRTAQDWRVHSFSRASSISTPSPGPSTARIAPSAYCTGRRTTSPVRSSGPNSSQPQVTGAAASATWR
jgi:hypothetical protein